MSIKTIIENIKSKVLLQAMGLLDQLYQKAIENEEKLAAAEAKCAALAAENAGLKAAAEFATAPDMWEELGGNVMRYQYQEWYADKLKSAIQAPATDTFLAEVRASAVDEACLKISNAIINCYQDEQIGLDAAATICGDFAAQLRQGAAQ